MKRAFLLAGAATVSLSWSVAAFAAALPADDAAAAARQSGNDTAGQPTPENTNNAGESNTIEQVVVTARKQEEALIEVPVTVDALSAQRIDALGLSDFKNLANFTPNVVINGGTAFNGRAGTQIIIRGQTPSIQSNASVFIDGTPLSAGYVEGIDDLARVEVLKGPQTAYFGRSTFSGAINLVTRTPSDTYQGRAEAMVGSSHLHDERLSFEGPVPYVNNLDFRATFRDYATDGTYKNNVDGTTLGDQSTYLGTFALRWKPIDRLTVNAFVLVEHDEDGPSTYTKVSVPNYNCNAGAHPGGPYNFICGTAPATSPLPLAQDAITNSFKSYVLDNSTHFFNPIFSDQFLDHNGYARHTIHLHLNIDYDLGFARFTSLSSYNDSRIISIFDLDEENSTNLPNPLPITSPTQLPTFNQLIRSEQYFDDLFQEFRLTSTTRSRFHWMIGGSYAQSETANLVSSQSYAGLVAFGLGATTRTRTPAVFGSLSYDILHNLTFSAEGRYQSDQVQSFKRSSYMNLGALIAGATFNKFTPRLDLKYQVIPEAMLYVSYSEGTNPGTFNTSQLAFSPAVQAAVTAATGATEVVQPEDLKNYEGGVKAQFWHNRAFVTLAVYHAVWTNQIVPYTYVIPTDLGGNGTAAVTVQTNIGQTNLNGVEFEGEVKPIRQLDLNGTFGYNGSDIRKYVCFACVPITGTTDVIGHSLYRFPIYNGSLGVQWTDHAFADYDWYARGDYFYKGPAFADETNVTKSKAQEVANFRVGLQSNKIRLEAFVTNAFNNKGPTSFVRNTDGLRHNAFDYVEGQPVLRQGGVRLTYNF